MTASPRLPRSWIGCSRVEKSLRKREGWPANRNYRRNAQSSVQSSYGVQSS